jgi:hypothetical protein
VTSSFSFAKVDITDWVIYKGKNFILADGSGDWEVQDFDISIC